MYVQGKVEQRKIKVYISRDRGRLAYRVHIGSREILKTTRHDRGHEWIARTLPDHFKFYLVLSQPEVRAKTQALIQILELSPELKRITGVLVSYTTLDQETLECIKLLKEHKIEVMLDSGAFHTLQHKIPLDQYLSWLNEYVEFVNSHIDLFDWIVTADIPCDSRPDTSIQQLPNRRKIEMTIDNTLYIIDRIEDPRKFMIVIQGYHPEEYAFCCELYKRYGIVTARVGVGSLCIRKYSENGVQEVKQILETVKQNLPGWVKLHAFGLNIRFLKHEEIFRLIHSSDSAAYAQTYARFGRVKLFDPATGTVKEIDVVRNGIVQEVGPLTIWFWNILSFLLQVKYIIDLHVGRKSG